jgi:hypothetical protein
VSGGVISPLAICRADAFGARPLAGVNAAAEARGGRDLEGLGEGEDAVGDAQAVALGDPAHEARRGGALEVHVELGLGDHDRAGPKRSRIAGGVASGGSSPTV